MMRPWKKPTSVSVMKLIDIQKTTTMAIKILEKVGNVRNPDTHEIPKKASLLRMHVLLRAEVMWFLFP